MPTCLVVAQFERKGGCEDGKEMSAFVTLNFNVIVYVAAACIAVLLAVTVFLKLRR